MQGREKTDGGPELSGRWSVLKEERTLAWLAYLNGDDPEKPNIEDCVGDEARKVQGNVIKTQPHNAGEKAQKSQNEMRVQGEDIPTHQEKVDSYQQAS